VLLDSGSSKTRVADDLIEMSFYVEFSFSAHVALLDRFLDRTDTSSRTWRAVR
jgi:hypothetical protein